MTVKPFGLLPAIGIFVLSVGLVNHVLIVPMLLEVASRDAWMSVFVALTVIIPWTAIPLFGLLIKLNHQRFDRWLLERLPAVAAWAIIILLLILIAITGMETLVITTSWTSTTYLTETPIYATVLVMSCLCVYAACKGLRTIAYVSCLLVPMVVLMGDFVMTTNLPHKDYRYLLPMLEHGFSPVIAASFNCITAFSELFMLLFIQHHLKSRFKRWHLLVLVLLLALLTIGPLTGAISQFGPEESEKMKYPAFSQWRLVVIGRYFEHVDFFAIFQWLSGALVRISLSLYIFAEFMPVGSPKRKRIVILLLALLFSANAWYWNDHMIQYAYLVHKGFQYLGVVTVFVITVVYAASFLQRRNKHEHRDGSGKAEKRDA